MRTGRGQELLEVFATNGGTESGLGGHRSI
jgi:hypothetical protein